MKRQELWMTLIAASAACWMACGYADDAPDYYPDDGGYDYGPDESDASGVLGQAVTAHDSFGISNEGTNKMFRCLATQFNCMLPAKKKVQIKFDDTGILASDRPAWVLAIHDAVSRACAALPDPGGGVCRYSIFADAGCNTDRVCMTFKPNGGVTVPAGDGSDSIRRYVGNVGYSTIVTLPGGSRKTFRGMQVNGNWTALKAYRGDAVCTQTTGDACYNGMVHMALLALDLASGMGITTNTSADGKGNDADVNGTGTTGSLAATPDLCRFNAYSDANPAVFTPVADSCGF